MCVLAHTYWTLSLSARSLFWAPPVGSTRLWLCLWSSTLSSLSSPSTISNPYFLPNPFHLCLFLNVIVLDFVVFIFEYAIKPKTHIKFCLFHPFPNLSHPDLTQTHSKIGLFNHFRIWVLTICLVFQSEYGFYLLGSYPHNHGMVDPLLVKVNSLTSIETKMPFSYYNLPFCKPQGGVKDSAKNLGELLMGDWIENSPFLFKMYTNKSEIFLCKSDLLSANNFKK